MAKKKRTERMCITAAGCLILGIGIGLCDHAALGTDPFTVFLVGLQRNVGFTVGSLNLVVNLLMIAFAYFVDKQKVSIVTFLATLFTSAGIDAIGFLFSQPVTGRLSAILFLLIGELFYVLGCALSIAPDAGCDPYNAFLLSVRKLTNAKYKTVRWIVELLFLISGYLLGGIVGIGTAFSLIATAPLVERAVRIIRRKFLH